MGLTIIQGSCSTALSRYPQRHFDCIFADPPDNIGLGYDGYNDRLKREVYVKALAEWVEWFVSRASTVWLSFNPIWVLDMAEAVRLATAYPREVQFKECVQVFTFGQHNKNDLGINHRCLWRLRWPDAPLYPNAVKIPSWRQLNGDKRAAEGGRVPGDVFDVQYPEYIEAGTVFDFPRVTGNSKQRQSWHPTQLHEDLVERCLRLCTKEGDRVCDPFAGTGTTARVAKKIGLDCTLIEIDPAYVAELCLALEPDTVKTQ